MEEINNGNKIIASVKKDEYGKPYVHVHDMFLFMQELKAITEQKINLNV